jgi:phosphoribosylformimino-5-aminoimidazole carboxamide ribotide isomerase
VIPVIDLMGGQVVHAQRGDRAHYRPIRSRLCRSSRIEGVVAGLLGLFPFRHLYVADVDALCGRGLQRKALDAVRASAKHVQLWIDAGIRDTGDLAQVSRWGLAVLGSETLTAAAWERLAGAEADAEAAADAVLSLDFRESDFLGAPALLQQPQRWPRRLIAMSLARVGSGLGPDLPRIESLHRLAPQCRVYAGGGVRSAGDLDDCRRAGACGALVASSLHDGRLGAADLDRLARRP